MKSVIEKSGRRRRLNSPSIRSSLGQPAKSSLFDWKEAAGMAASVLAMKRFPKVAIVGLLAIGVYIGMKIVKNKHHESEEAVPEYLH